MTRRNVALRSDGQQAWGFPAAIAAGRRRRTPGVPGPRRRGHAVAGSSLLVRHSAANRAGAFIPSAEWGRRQL